MNITCPNPNCRQSIAIEREHAGTIANCPFCGQPMQLPTLTEFPRSELVPISHRPPSTPSFHRVSTPRRNPLVIPLVIVTVLLIVVTVRFVPHDFVGSRGQEGMNLPVPTTTDTESATGNSTEQAPPVKQPDVATATGPTLSEKSKTLPFAWCVSSTLDGFHGPTSQAPPPTATSDQRFFVIALKCKLPEKPSQDRIGKVFEKSSSGARYVKNPVCLVQQGNKPLQLAGGKTPDVEAIAMARTAADGEVFHFGWLIIHDTTISLAYMIEKDVRQLKVNYVKDGKVAVHDVLLPE